MDKNLNYYGILEVNKISTQSDIKKSYYFLSKKYHPDKNKEEEAEEKFKNISEAYKILSDQELRNDYDLKSKYGQNYDESLEFLDYDHNNNSKVWDDDKLDKFKKNNILNIIFKTDDSFNGSLEYERWVICKDCKGDGKDTKSKIEIKDENGNLLKMFDGSEGCDFCEGSGKVDDIDCFFCAGKGKVGWSPCNTCKGEKRILGKQKLSGIKIPKDLKIHKIESMGHFSKDFMGKVGHLWIIKE